MADHDRRSRLLLLCTALLASACATARVAEQPARRPETAAVVTPTPRDALYPVDEALRDALSGPLEHVGTGAWPGNNRVPACVFRNQRVLVVNVYCSITEQQAFRVDFYSPERGRVRIYAEANGPVSSFMRQQYFSFTAESEPASPALPKVSLAMSFEELHAYEQQRYEAYLPACFGGQERAQRREGCLGTLAPRADSWSARNRNFLERANDDWYRAVRELRALAVRHGREPS